MKKNNVNNTKIIFMGTSDFAVKSLENLVKNNFDVKMVVTQPDKPQGRKKEICSPPVKICAKNFDIKVFQPNSLKKSESIEILSEINPDFIVVAAYGKILPEGVLNIPKISCINVHGSILPKLRGAAPIQWAILNGETQTGITIMKMDSGMDTGDILFQRKTPVNETETAGELMARLADIGAELLVESLEKIIELGEINKFRIKQNDSLATYSKIIKKENGIIDWRESAVKISRLVRAMNPWPVAFTFLDDKIFKIHKANILKENNLCGDCGELSSRDPAIVCCGKDVLELIEVQIEGKKQMPAVNFFRGYKIGEKIKFKNLFSQI
ncbi:MAG: methionyl-tRNA formyltransferase [Oscillospiraceae bacterium]|jgi:methionyl-tRNA formyltransferase|nr:methionyl-tRNA formyltransferase [Oscillospiraceae bacterium]